MQQNNESKMCGGTDLYDGLCLGPDLGHVQSRGLHLVASRGLLARHGSQPRFRRNLENGIKKILRVF
jgi:hypothetical protein